PVAALPMGTDEIIDGDVGAEVRVFGFGRADASVAPGALPARRAGISTLAAYTELNFTMTPGPSQSFGGYSGRPTTWPVNGLATRGTAAALPLRMATRRLLSIASLLVLASSCASGLGDTHKWDTGVAEAPLLAVPPSAISSSQLKIGKWYVYRFRDGLSVVGL